MADAKGRILIVDDDPHAVEILTRMLEREGYECTGAAGGPAALETVQNRAIDVILLDVMMPGMDGLQVCERLRGDETLRQIPVILVTAKDDMETRSKGMALGVSEYLTKPVNKKEFLTRLEAQIRNRSRQRQLARMAAAIENASQK